jgi:hypothetical protein
MVISFEGMNAVLEVDTDDHVAVVQPGVKAPAGHPGGVRAATTVLTLAILFTALAIVVQFVL